MCAKHDSQKGLVERVRLAGGRWTENEGEREEILENRFVLGRSWRLLLLCHVPGQQRGIFQYECYDVIHHSEETMLCTNDELYVTGIVCFVCVYMMPDLACIC